MGGMKKRLTPEQMAAHIAECDGCGICHGEAPTQGRLERIAQDLHVLEMFQTFDSTPSPQLAQLLALVEAEKATRATNASLPRRNIMSIGDVNAKVESYCQHMIDIGDLPGNPGWTKTLAQWGGEHDEHRRFAQWRDFARHLKERRISKADMIKTLTNWKPKGR